MWKFEGVCHTCALKVGGLSSPCRAKSWYPNDGSSTNRATGEGGTTSSSNPAYENHNILIQELQTKDS